MEGEPESAAVAIALWRRLDGVGHDACALYRHRHGWLLTGTVVGRIASAADEMAHLRYTVDSAIDWTTRTAEVTGWIGPRTVSRRIVRRDDGTWTVNDTRHDVLSGCTQLDLGFTPATNILQLRAKAFPLHTTVHVAVAWLDDSARDCVRLEQQYHRVDDERFAYAAPSVGYAGELLVDADGFIRRYPGLWERD